ncbi:ABC transporter ATP-binding protein [Zeimonas arvi]|uniref:ABC transporter ATP-binding protein n=1 Tax=Zeimonas arvi TaxID=2498847 RepID=A0A5C8NUD7_9BURK|nr:ABC transporter ATP-binding protein [Zeimonas arvi]TXL64786.1 ABC transporter ATP-binding protein [Zeimonas arvi]
MTTAAVSLEDIVVEFGTVRAVDGVSLEIRPGEFFTLLGPSGSGKTTCLRLIGGFQYPTRGRVLIDGQDATRLPPYARDVNTVFQDYALFPHMNVRDNVAYGLMVRGIPKGARHARADRLLEQVRLSGVGDRRPSQLSGGQRQRVALARALVNEPKVLLLDEPLGALDLKLREQMQAELKALQRRLGITFVFVTHDQHEALSMSDRIGVFSQGRIEQVGSPREVYERPATRFVAEFVGAANLIEGEAARRYADGAACALLRPERIRVGAAQDARATGRVASVHYYGAFSRIAVDCGDATLEVDSPNAAGPAVEPGQQVHLHWQPDAIHAIPA